MRFLFARGDKHRPDAITLFFKVSLKQAADWITFVPCRTRSLIGCFLNFSVASKNTTAAFANDSAAIMIMVLKFVVLKTSRWQNKRTYPFSSLVSKEVKIIGRMSRA